VSVGVWIDATAAPTITQVLSAFISLRLDYCNSLLLGQKRSEGVRVRGCGPHQAALARGRQIGENCIKKSREISDCKFHMFTSAIKTVLEQQVIRCLRKT